MLMSNTIVIPTKTSQLFNDKGFITQAEVEVLLENLLIELNSVTIQIIYPEYTTGDFAGRSYVTIDGVQYKETQILKVPKGTPVIVTVAQQDIIYDGTPIAVYSYSFIADVSHKIEFRGMSDYQGSATITPSVNLQNEE